MDTLIAARQVGEHGRVIGIENSPQMAQLARRNAAEAGAANVTIVDALVEEIPFPDACADAALSNGVFNLSPEKQRVIEELARLLRSGGVLTAAEIVLTTLFAIFTVTYGWATAHNLQACESLAPQVTQVEAPDV